MKHHLFPLAARLYACAASFLLLALTAWMACLPVVREETVTVLSQTASPLLEYHADRETLRRQETEQLQALIDDPSTDDTTRSAAGSRLLDLMRWAEQETDIEELLTAQGFDAVLVSVHQDSAQVLVRADALSQGDAALILELTARQTGLTGGAIKVIPVPG